MEQQLLGTPGVLLAFVGTECKSRRWKHAVYTVLQATLTPADCREERVVRRPAALSALLFCFIPPSIWRKERSTSNNQCRNQKSNVGERAIFPSFVNVWSESETATRKPKICSWLTCSRTQRRSYFFSFRAFGATLFAVAPSVVFLRVNKRNVATCTLAPWHTKKKPMHKIKIIILFILVGWFFPPFADDIVLRNSRVARK